MAAWAPYDTWMELQWNGGAIDLNLAANIKIGLVTSVYTPNLATDTLFSVIDANEVSGTNYTAGGTALASPTVTLAAGTVTFDGADITWTQSGAGFSNARHAVAYKVSGTNVITTNDFGADKGNVAGDLILEMDAAGILTVTG